jgi:hypothetical protein
MTEPNLKFRWFQFSLRALLVLMLVVAAYFAGFATSQKLAERAIQKAREDAAAQLEVAQKNAEIAQIRAAEAEAIARYEAAFQAATRAALTK